MLSCFTSQRVKNIIPIKIVLQNDFEKWFKTQDAFTKEWLLTTKFRNDVGAYSLIPSNKGKLKAVLCIINTEKNIWSVGQFPFLLPQGCYELEVNKKDYFYYAIGWGLGAYQFNVYKKAMRAPSELFLPKDLSSKEINNIVESIYWVRDLINFPTDDLGPSEFARKVMVFAKTYQAKCTQIVGKELIKQNYPAIHAVGRASDDEPRLVDLRWGQKKHPKITLVGKGVCFDTGGLDIKNSSSMLLMKKDMGGAAHVLGLARMIMEAKLPVCLRVLIPMVENSVSGNSYRPGDVIKSRKGLTIEIGNTDAEGRVVLADALTEAVADQPELIIDMATLTGAARIALGTDVPVLFSNNDQVANDIIESSQNEYDPLWRLPLYSPYRESLCSTIADINNASLDSYGGAITAALFLKEFVPDEIPWVHFDLMAWNLRTRPGRPQGGEAMALRALFAYLTQKFNLKKN